MKRLPARVAVILAVVLMLPVAEPPVASAATMGEFVFLGTLVTPVGLDLPCATPGKPCPPVIAPRLKTDPKGMPLVNLTTTGNATAFTFTTTACVDVKVGTKTSAGPCAITARGHMLGHCLLATGTGVMTITSSAGFVYTFAFKLGWDGHLLITGGDATANIYSLMALMGPGCENKTATMFTGPGTLKLKDL